MATTTKIGFTEQSSSVVANVTIESDTLSSEEVLKLSTEYMLKALSESETMKMRFKR